MINLFLSSDCVFFSVDYSSHEIEPITCDCMCSQFRKPMISCSWQFFVRLVILSVFFAPCSSPPTCLSSIVCAVCCVCARAIRAHILSMIVYPIFFTMCILFWFGVENTHNGTMFCENIHIFCTFVVCVCFLFRILN